MSLWFTLMINADSIGSCEIRRNEPLDLTDPAAIADTVSTYTVHINGDRRAVVDHRYGAGAWPLVRTALQAAVPIPRADNPITPRQLEVLALIAQGLQANEIASKLFIEATTVRTLCKLLRGRLGARNLVHAVAIAYERGLLP